MYMNTCTCCRYDNNHVPGVIGTNYHTFDVHVHVHVLSHSSGCEYTVCTCTCTAVCVRPDKPCMGYSCLAWAGLRGSLETITGTIHMT